MWHDYEISQKTMQQKESRGWAKYEKRKKYYGQFFIK